MNLQTVGAATASEKERRRALGENRALDPWERYRVMNDAMDEAYELRSMASREARFALVMMGGLNAGMFLVATRGELVALLPPVGRWTAAALAGGYGIVAVYCALQAIEALRPRKHLCRLEGVEFRPAQLRYFEDVIERAPEEHWRAWQDVKLGELNADLAAQTHSVARANAAKRAALRRLYVGIRAMVVLAAAFVTLLAFFALLR
jgi:hypothetical protein